MSFRPRLTPFVACCFVVIGCATGHDVSSRGGDGGRRDAFVSTTEDANVGVCDPPCDEGFMCEAGSCVPATDADGDGLAAADDCDDGDETVGATAERVCTGACGEGIERCSFGRWEACEAPTSCDCDPGTPARTIPCERCGTQRQICSGGTWVDDGVCTGGGSCSPGEIGTGGDCGNCGTERRTCGMDCTWGAWACEGEGVCAAGEIEEESEACGSCGGSRMRSRTCGLDCSWGAYGAWGTCVDGGGGVCTAGETDSETRACACGGTETRTRTCSSATCDWGTWSAWGACTGGSGACTPGATRACPNGDTCGHQVCTSSCTWGACQPIMPGGCLRIRPGTTGPAGNNYRCCTLSPTDMGWQFCLPSCTWSTSCEATTSC